MKHARGAAAVALAFDRTAAVRIVQPQTPGGTGMPDRDRLCRIHGVPAIAFARVSTQAAVVRIPIRDEHQHELARLPPRQSWRCGPHRVRDAAGKTQDGGKKQPGNTEDAMAIVKHVNSRECGAGFRHLLECSTLVSAQKADSVFQSCLGVRIFQSKS